MTFTGPRVFTIGAPERPGGPSGLDRPHVGPGSWAEGPVPHPVPAAPLKRREPHSPATVERVRLMFTTTTLTYKEIGRRLGVGAASVCRYAQAGGWTQPPGAPAPTDRGRHGLPTPGLKGRRLAIRLQQRAERMLAALERDPDAHPHDLVAVLELLKEAKVLARRKRPSERTGVYFPGGKVPEDLAEILLRLRKGATLDEIGEHVNRTAAGGSFRSPLARS